MGFSNSQIKKLQAKLNARNIRTRCKNGVTLSYIEGWHAIAEANRIFGFDSWDRETVLMEIVSEAAEGGLYRYGAQARVRVKVRTDEDIVTREGTGFGRGESATRLDAYELASKEAETDAMKRALMTFGNPFGLALYDKTRSGVLYPKGKSSVRWSILNERGQEIAVEANPTEYCAKVKGLLAAYSDHQNMISFWSQNQETVIKLRTTRPDLATPKGRHFGELLSEFYTQQLERLARGKSGVHIGSSEVLRKAEPDENQIAPSIDVENTSLILPDIAKSDNRPNFSSHKGPLRVRDNEHLSFVRSQPCVVCGRTPSQAHHLKHVQPRAMSKKSGDQWTVPLCAIHHRELHDAGDEGRWWASINIDGRAEAERLWSVSNDNAESMR